MSTKGISRVFGEHLAERLNRTRIIVYPEPADTARLEVRYSINRLDGTLGGPVVLQIDWQVVDLPSGEVLRAASTNREIGGPHQTQDVPAYLQQISAAIGTWAEEVATEIRAGREATLRNKGKLQGRRLLGRVAKRRKRIMVMRSSDMANY